MGQQILATLLRRRKRRQGDGRAALGSGRGASLHEALHWLQRPLYQGVFKEIKESFHKYHLVRPFVFVILDSGEIVL